MSASMSAFASISPFASVFALPSWVYGDDENMKLRKEKCLFLSFFPFFSIHFICLFFK
jgi:hypothetical protein